MTAPGKDALTLRDHRHNLMFNSIHEMFWGYGVAFHSTYAVVPIFLKRLGAPDIIIVSVAGVFVIMAAIPQIMTAFAGRNIRNVKLAVITVHGLPIPPIFLAGFIFTFIGPRGPSAWIIYYICYLLFTLGLGVVFPIWADFLETVHIPERRGSFFGISFAFNFLAGGIGGVTTKKLLESVPFPANFGYGFLIYAGCILSAALIFIPYRTRIKRRTSESKTLKEFLREVRNVLSRDGNFRRYLVSRIFFTANYPAISLYAVYIHDKIHYPISEVGIFTAITVMAAGLSSYGAGWIGDRLGHKRSMVFVFLAYLLALVTALTAESLTHAYIIFVFLGMGQGGFFTTAMSLIYEFAGEQDKKIYFALTDTMTAPFVFISIVLSGLLIPRLGVPPVLMGIGLFIIIGTLSLALLTKEPKTVHAGLPHGETLL